MKKTSLLLLFLGLAALAFSQSHASPQWTKVLSDKPATFQTQLLSTSENSIKVNVQVPGFYTTTVTTPRGAANVITVPKSVSTFQAGEPDMPMTCIPLMIGDKARMEVRVIDAQYTDFEGIEVAPSKGDFPRSIDPKTVPYTYGDSYGKDAFFPAQNMELYEPYILRDFRGQNIAVYPFAYNPVSKTLRVYYNMTLELYKVDDKGENVIESRRSSDVRLDPDFKSVYQRHFLNFEECAAKYTPLDENGDLLIICYDSFISSMTDFVNWKKTRGINTTIVGTSTAGSTYSAIKSYIQSQYNANNNLTHVLLVGDVAQIPGYSYSGGGSSYSGLGDNAFGQIVGSDIYNDLFIGRFSASSAAQVTSQVQKVIKYERDLTTTDTWLQNGLGVSTSEGSGGHNNEDDYQHIENLRTDLLNYGYSTVYQDYNSVSGYPSSTTTTISNHINSGVGIINYCNHGSETQWQSHYYSNSHVNALTNSNKLPFIFSVACLNGKYDYSGGDCFAETWMHASHNTSGAPTGAIGTLMSYISQPWVPPMWAQDEFVDILIESHTNNIKHTWGGTAINGIMAIFDNYSTSTQTAVGTYQAWVLFGDPSMMLRTKTPQAMTVTHNGILDVTQTTYTVSVSNGNSALATITDASHNILGKATVSNGTANIQVNGTLQGGDQLTLCVFGYNKVTYLGTINVVAGEQYAISVEADPEEGGTVSGGGDYYENASCTLTATSNRGYAFAGWSLDGTVISTQPTYTFTVTGDASYTALFTALTAHQVETLPTEHGTVTLSPSTAYAGETVTLSATAESGYTFSTWIVYKGGDINNRVAVNGNQFVMPDEDVTVAALFVAMAGNGVTIGSGTGANNNLPTYAYFKYSLSQQIYTATELGGPLTITAIAFKNSTNEAGRNLDIYLKHTTKSTFSTSKDWETMAESDKVFSGTVNFPASGWFTIYLETPFEYNGTDNLLLCVDDNTAAAIATSAAPKCYTYNTGERRSIRISRDSNDLIPTDATSLAAYSGSVFTNNNQILFVTGTPNNEATINVSPEALEGFSYDYGQGPSEIQALTLLASCSEDLVVTAPEHFELSPAATGPFTASFTIPSANTISTNLYVRLKAGLSAGAYNAEPLQFQSGETVKSIPLSGEVVRTSHFVYEGNQFAYNMTVFAVIQIDGVEQHTDALEIGAFCGDECRGMAKPMYCPPVDRYIVPLMVYGESNDLITFKLYDYELEQEWETIAETTLDFDAEGYGSITDPTAINFTSQTVVPEDQTIVLNAGWNWYSSYLEYGETALADLEEAIVGQTDAAVIKSQNAFINFEDGEWNGNIAFVNEQMYMINLTEDIEFVLAGTLADPAAHPITLSAGGYSWISFLLPQAMTLTEALSNLTPTEGDVIKNESGFSTYHEGIGWSGSINQLVPGKGYMYFNNGTEDKTLVFPGTAKK